MVLRVRESLDNGVQNYKAKNVRPQQVEQKQGNCTDEQGDDPVFRVEFQFEHSELRDGIVVRNGRPRSLQPRGDVSAQLHDQEGGPGAQDDQERARRREFRPRRRSGQG